MHVSADFPDPFAADKTMAIHRLVDLAGARFVPRVHSLNRLGAGALAAAARSLPFPAARRRFPEMAAKPFDYGTAWSYRAPGKGLAHARALHGVGRRLAEAIQAEGGADLLVGHKVTIEGIAVRTAAAQLGVPYALSLQGNTDTRILRMRPDLHPTLRGVFHDATMVFAFAPWALKAFERTLGKRSGPVALLPCATELDAIVTPQPNGEGIVSVFHLRHAKLKNLSGLVQAITLLRARGVEDRLRIIGGGSARDVATCDREIADARGITRVGPRHGDALVQALNTAKVMVVPSQRESFGMVFIEALLAGVPVIYPKGRAIDGYFDGAPFAIGVDPDDPAAIADAIMHALTNESALKAALATWQASADAAAFQRPAIARTFIDGLEAALASGRRPA